MRRALLVVLAASACSHDHGPAHVRGLPKPDGVPALRTGGPRTPRLASYKIDATLLETRTPANAFLDRQPGWKRVYGDDIAVLHVRQTAPAAE